MRLMAGTSSMRLIAASAVVVFAGLLGGCSPATEEATLNSYRLGDSDSQLIVVATAGGDVYQHEYVDVDETDEQVTVSVLVVKSTGDQAAMASIFDVPVELAAPLGDRKVFDNKSGKQLGLNPGLITVAD